MATPHVTGAVALLLAERPGLNAGEIKALLQGHATLDAFTGGVCGNTWGCGKLNIADISLSGVGAPTLTAPEDAALLNTRRPLFDWDPSAGDVAGYRLVVSGDAVVVDLVIAHPTTSFQVTGDLADGVYRWRVTARDTAGNTAASEARSFTIDTVPPLAPDLVAPLEGHRR
jgi:hypothetical protein